jgi:hypothetical protein
MFLQNPMNLKIAIGLIAGGFVEIWIGWGMIGQGWRNVCTARVPLTNKIYLTGTAARFGGILLMLFGLIFVVVGVISVPFFLWILWAGIMRK